jgi:hypothetical protein
VHDWAPDEYEFVVKVMANKKPVLSLSFLFLYEHICFLFCYGFHFYYCSYHQGKYIQWGSGEMIDVFTLLAGESHVLSVEGTQTVSIGDLTCEIFGHHHHHHHHHTGACESTQASPISTCLERNKKINYYCLDKPR